MKQKYLIPLLSLVIMVSIGAQAQNSRDGDMVVVPAGEFGMGCYGLVDGLCEPEEWPYHKVWLDEFKIDKYEVTTGQYEECVSAGACEEAAQHIAGDKFTDRCNYGNPDKTDHPINCLIWRDAEAYCRWAGKHLPTEAQWEKAARGTDGRAYPWGNEEANCEFAVLPLKGVNSKVQDFGCGRVSTWPVGSKRRDISPYGAMDMAGNVSEWVADWYDRGSAMVSNYYETGPARNPTGPESGKLRITRGASYSWWDMTSAARTSARHGLVPGEAEDRKRFSGYGFRCAK